MLRTQVIAGEHLYFAAERLCLLAFLADVLALARAERGKEAVEISEPVIVPMELLAFAGQQAQLLGC